MVGHGQLILPRDPHTIGGLSPDVSMELWPIKPFRARGDFYCGSEVDLIKNTLELAVLAEVIDDRVSVP